MNVLIQSEGIKDYECLLILQSRGSLGDCGIELLHVGTCTYKPPVRRKEKLRPIPAHNAEEVGGTGEHASMHAWCTSVDM